MLNSTVTGNWNGLKSGMSNNEALTLFLFLASSVSRGAAKHSLNLMKAETKANLIDRVRTIIGLTDDERAALLGLLRESKPYGLVWEDKPEDVEERLRDELPVLVEDKTKYIPSDDPEAPNHILIEGDNLEALTTLAYTHAGKIDVIYIDPPYNTGNTDRDGGFYYNDNFVAKDDDYKHSKWLSFMKRRLVIAKKLLSENGIMFISIGDHELSQLMSLCKDIFLDKNYIETYIWISTNRPDNSSPILRRNAEFVICVAKNLENIKEFRGVISPTSGMPSLTKSKEKIKTITFPANVVHTNLPDGIYYAGLKDNGRNPKWELMEDVVVEDGIITTPLTVRGHSYWATQKKIKEELAEGTEIWIKSESFVPYYKKTKDAINRPTKILIGDIVKDGLYANTELNAGIFHEKVFNNPKPSTLVKFLINFIPANIVLDFFAGSGTTLHAVMELNNEDEGKRTCIMIQSPENGICENVTYERNKRVINGYDKPNGEHVDGLTGNSLRYFRTAFVGRDRSPRNLRQLVALSTDMLCIKEDLYTEVKEFAGQKSFKNIFRYFERGNKRMMVIYHEQAVPEIVKLIDSYELPRGEKIKVYVFSPSEDPWSGDFEDVSDKVELCALPMAILNAYKRVLPKRRDKVVYVEPESETPSAPSTSLFPETEGGEL